MALTKEELDRLVDETHHRGLIAGRVYCGNCGYNLKTLPYVYRCPECGNAYNARPLTMRGIFMPYQYAIPFRDLAATVVCAAGAATLGYFTLKFGSRAQPVAFMIPYLLAVVLGLIAVLFAWRSYEELCRFALSRSIARRIAAEEAEAE